MNWWRLPKKEPTLDELIKRVAQLEREVQKGRAKTLYRHVMDYMPLEHPGVVRDMQDRIIETPVRVQDWLDKAALAKWGDLPRVEASAVSWRDTLTPRRVLASDGAQVLNTVTETIMCPDFTFAADYMEIGDTFKYTLLFDCSTIAGTQTQTYRIRWGGAGGTSLAASGAFQADPTAVSTTVSQALQWYVVVRSVGSAGSMFAMGLFTPNDFDDASATTLQGNLNMLLAPVSAPAAVGSLNTTAATALSPTVAFSVATSTVQVTNHIALLESLN
jgi:hypothetical protein